MIKNSFKEGFLMNYYLTRDIYKNTNIFIFVVIMCLLSAFKSEYIHSQILLLDFLKTFLPFFLISLIVNNKNNQLSNVKNFFSPLIKIRMYILFLILTIFLLFGLSTSLKSVPEFVDLGKYTIEKFQEEVQTNPEIVNEENYEGKLLVSIFEEDENFKNKLNLLENIEKKNIYMFFSILFLFFIIVSLIASLSLPIIFNTDIGVFKSIWLAIKYNIKYYKTIIAFGFPYLVVGFILGYFLFFKNIHWLSFVFNFYILIVFIYYSSTLFKNIFQKQS